MYLAARGHAEKFPRLEKNPQFNRTIFKTITELLTSAKSEVTSPCLRAVQAYKGNTTTGLVSLRSDNLGSAQRCIEDLLNTNFNLVLELASWKKYPGFTNVQNQFNTEQRVKEIINQKVLDRNEITCPHRWLVSHLLLMDACLPQILPPAFRSPLSRQQLLP